MSIRSARRSTNSVPLPALTRPSSSTQGRREIMLVRSPRRSAALILLVVFVSVAAVAGAQLDYWSGQSVAPVFEGWEPNPDGSFNFVFGYFNRNHEEVLDIPAGPNNGIEPGGPDQGQPTVF